MYEPWEMLRCELYGPPFDLKDKCRCVSCQTAKWCRESNTKFIKQQAAVDAARELHKNIPSNVAVVGQWQLELALRALDGEQ